MHKLNIHVLALLGALVFCVALVNMVSDDDASKLAIAHVEAKSRRVIPTLSSAVYKYQKELTLPELEHNHTNEYLELIKHELEVAPALTQKLAVPEKTEKQLPKKPVVTTTPKKKVVAKKKDYVEKWAIVTAYCPCSKCCGRGTPGRTSTGTSAWKPGIAADPRAVPYGSEIYVKGYGQRRVDDTGGAMRRSWRRKGVLHLDIRMTYHYNAVKWGRRYMKVRIYKKKK